MSEDYLSRKTYKYGEFTITSTTLNTPKEQLDEIANNLCKILAKGQRDREEREKSKEPL
ncbi:hypothetical protein [Lachnotalea glycerini]|uniref:hypothetical protein n=1 Tax=Lachnotalea glycerini TaxID=1763509 RepID=UPI0015F26309|nr:hypothetical protein [Lachnotalea glycerini]